MNPKLLRPRIETPHLAGSKIRQPESPSRAEARCARRKSLLGPRISFDASCFRIDRHELHRTMTRQSHPDHTVSTNNGRMSPRAGRGNVIALERFLLDVEAPNLVNVTLGKPSNCSAWVNRQAVRHHLFIARYPVLSKSGAQCRIRDFGVVDLFRTRWFSVRSQGGVRSEILFQPGSQSGKHSRGPHRGFVCCIAPHHDGKETPPLLGCVSPALDHIAEI